MQTVHGRRSREGLQVRTLAINWLCGSSMAWSLTIKWSQNESNYEWSEVLGKFLHKNVRKSSFLLFETVHLECHPAFLHPQNVPKLSSAAGWSFAPDPTEKPTALPQTSIAGLMGLISKRGRGGKGKVTKEGREGKRRKRRGDKERDFGVWTLT